jgi:curved DNA-binding protein
VDFKDYYAILGVPKTATDAEIKRAYRKLARKLHPDVNPGDKKAESQFKDVNEANEVLSDPDKRRKYDELGANWRAYEHTPPPGAGADAGGWNVNFGGGGGTYRTMTPEEMEGMFGTNDPFSDFFHTFFGRSDAGPFRPSGGRRGQVEHPRRGRDIEDVVDLTLEEAFGGASRHMEIRHAGKTRSVEVRIPAGVKEGSRVRVAGEGEAVNGGTSGDLYLRVHVTPHPRFERRDQDLHVRVDVPVTTAVLGGEIAVPSLSGSTLRLKVPAMTDSGKVFRLRGHGMPAIGRPKERGDLYATVEIRIPATLSTDAKDLYEKLKALEEKG